jgi:hypothetical protein
MAETTPGDSEIPALIAQKGREAWAWLHEQAVVGNLTSDRLQSEFKPMIPSYGCACVVKWDVILTKNPFRRDDQFAWSVEVHNAVNAILNKPTATTAEALKKWAP